MKIKEKDLRKIVKESLEKIILEQENNFSIVEYKPETEEWKYIESNKNEIWNFLDRGYKYAGYDKFCGCDTPKSLFKNAILVKIAICDGQWVAISVYTGYRGGFKNVGITATTDMTFRKIGVDAVKKIIKTDITNYAQFFWTECSGTVEVLYEHNNGIKIPNEYVYGILQKPVIKDEDGFHYVRNFKGEDQRKIIYGFNSLETFEKIKSEREKYINDSIQFILNMRIDESIETPSFGRLSTIDTFVAVVNFFVNERWEGECYEFPSRSLRLLRYYLTCIENLLNSNEVPEEKIKITKQALLNGRDVLETSSVMEINLL